MDPLNENQFDPYYAELFNSLTQHSQNLIRRGEYRILSDDEKQYLIEDINEHIEPGTIFPVLQCLLNSEEDEISEPPSEDLDQNQNPQQTLQINQPAQQPPIYCSNTIPIPQINQPLQQPLTRSDQMQPGQMRIILSNELPIPTTQSPQPRQTIILCLNEMPIQPSTRSNQMQPPQLSRGTLSYLNKREKREQAPPPHFNFVSVNPIPPEQRSMYPQYQTTAGNTMQFVQNKCPARKQRRINQSVNATIKNALNVPAPKKK